MAMRCPRLVEPIPPEDMTGWPWTIESPQLPDNDLRVDAIETR